MPGGERVRVSVHIGPDGEEYLTRAGAAELAGVEPDTITSWVRKGYLAPLEGCPPRRPLYARSAVEQAEAAAYEAAVRTSGSDKRVTRNLAS